MRPAEERIERCAQLVRQGREEIFLEAIRVLRIAIEQRVVEGERGAGGDIGREGQIAIVVAARLIEPIVNSPSERPRARSGTIMKDRAARGAEALRGVPPIAPSGSASPP